MNVRDARNEKAAYIIGSYIGQIINPELLNDIAAAMLAGTGERPAVTAREAAIEATYEDGSVISLGIGKPVQSTTVSA